MSNEQIKSILNVEFLGLPDKFDPDYQDGKITRAEVEKVFATQASLDRAKKDMTKAQFRKLIGVYFSKFISSDGFDVKALDKELKEKRELFRRHIGKDWLYFLTTLVRIHKEVEVKKELKPRGLLMVAT